jgi:lysophospholipase L1-like esterase
MKKFIQGTISISIGVVVALVIAELILQIHNPFPGRIKGNEILLTANYSKTIVMNPPVPGLDTTYVHTVNELGFRGESWPEDPSKRTKLITIGGSTTECSKMSNDKMWPEKMSQRLKKHIPNLWVNNAGIDGCSTYGHIVLLRDYVIDLKPDYALFLIGINDLGVAKFDREDSLLQNRKSTPWRTWLEKAEILMIADNIYRSYQAHTVKIGHLFMETDYVAKTNLSAAERMQDSLVQVKNLAFHHNYIPTYLARVDSITKLCKQNGIVPIFMTQPLLDTATNKKWPVIDIYNEALLHYCRKNKIMSIDLANAMPGVSAYYYDSMHYNNVGAALVGQLVADSLITKLLN